MKIHPLCEEIDVLITHLQVLGVKFEGQKKKEKPKNCAGVNLCRTTRLSGGNESLF